MSPLPQCLHLTFSASLLTKMTLTPDIRLMHGCNISKLKLVVRETLPQVKPSKARWRPQLFVSFQTSYLNVNGLNTFIIQHVIRRRIPEWLSPQQGYTHIQTHIHTHTHRHALTHKALGAVTGSGDHRKLQLKLESSVVHFTFKSLKHFS